METKILPSETLTNFMDTTINLLEIKILVMERTILPLVISILFKEIQIKELGAQME